MTYACATVPKLLPEVNGGRDLLKEITSNHHCSRGLPPPCASRDGIFGPVLIAISFASESEWLEIANDVEYCLAAYSCW